MHSNHVVVDGDHLIRAFLVVQETIRNTPNGEWRDSLRLTEDHLAEVLSEYIYPHVSGDHIADLDLEFEDGGEGRQLLVAQEPDTAGGE